LQVAVGAIVHFAVTATLAGEVIRPAVRAASRPMLTEPWPAPGCRRSGSSASESSITIAATGCPSRSTGNQTRPSPAADGVNGSPSASSSRPAGGSW
jgi:hypothetical protein